MVEAITDTRTVTILREFEDFGRGLLYGDGRRTSKLIVVSANGVLTLAIFRKFPKEN